MGNSKSKQRLHAGHERLNENDRYFAKVQARNSTTRSSRRFRKPHPVLAMKSCVTALTSIEAPQEKDDDSESLASKSPKPQDTKPFVGPLPPKMKTADDISTSSSFARVKQTLSSISEDKMSPTSVALPSPHSQFPFQQNDRKISLAKRRLERARANQIFPNSFPTDLSVASSQSSSSNVIQDYYTEMMDEAHRESRQAEAEGNRDASRTFDSMLPNGMVWAEVSRGGRVTCVAFSRCDKDKKPSEHPLLMAIGTDDGTVTVVEIMDVPSSPLHKQIEFGSNQSRKIGTVKELPREGTVRSVNFSPDGQWLIVGGDDCMACLLRVNLSESLGLGLTLSSVEMVQEFEREDRVYCVQFSPDGSKLALGGYDGIVAITSMEPPEMNKEESSTLPRLPLVLENELVRPGLILCLDWNPDGKLIAVGGSHKSCVLIDSESMKVIGEIQRTASVETVTWKPDGRHVAIGCSDGMVAVVNVESQTIAGEVVRGMPFIQDDKKKKTISRDSCHVNAICWSPDGQFLAIAGSDNCCAIVETGTFVLLHEIRRSGIVTCIDWRERRLLTGDEGRYLAVGGDDRAVAIMKTGVMNDEEESNSVADSDHSGASSSYFSIGSGSSISQHEWVLREDSFRDIEEVESFSHATAFAVSSTLDTAHSNTVVAAVSFSKHRKGDPSKYLVIAYSNGCVTIFDTGDLRHVAKQLIFSKTIKAIDFSRKSEVMVLGAEDGSVIVVSTENDWRTKKELNVSPSSIATIKFSRRNERLAIGSSDGILTLLDPNDDWKIAGEIESSDSSISCIDWSSRNLAVGRLDGSITVHESSRVYANFFLPEAELTRGDEPVYSVDFGVRGQFLAVGDGAGKIGIYSAKGGWVLCHQLNTSSAVLATKWSGDGHYLAFGGEHYDVGVRVVDTVVWANVKEMHKLAPTERFSTLEWSNNDKWMVLVCSNGCLHVIDTLNWKVQKSFPGLSIDRENEVDSTSNTEEVGSAHTVTGSKETETGSGKLRNSLKENRRWRDLPEVNRFLLASDLFLTAYRVKDPLPALRPLLKCVLMLTIHTKWVSTKNDDLVRRISRVDDGEPVAALLWVLGLCTDIMKQVMRKTADNGSYSPSFGLGPRDMRRIQAWNEQWLLVDPSASCVDVTLLRDANETS